MLVGVLWMPSVGLTMSDVWCLPEWPQTIESCQAGLASTLEPGDSLVTACCAHNCADAMPGTFDT